MRTDLAQRIPRDRAATLFYAVGAVFLFAWWRVLGIPFPGSLGRLIPLAWLLTGLVLPAGCGPPSGMAVSAGAVSALTMLLWGGGEVLMMVCAVLQLAALAPGMLVAARSRLGLARAVLPMAPLLLLLPLFTGDEPFNEAMSRSLASDLDLVISDDIRQLDPRAGVRPFYGNLEGGISHTMPVFPIALIPGLPLGIPGIRLMSLALAVLAAVLLTRLIAEVDPRGPPVWALAALLLFPGVSILGLAYPGWMVLVPLLIATRLGYERRLGFPLLILLCLLIAGIKLRFLPLCLGLFLMWLIDGNKGRRLRMALLTLALAALVLTVDLFALGGRFIWIRYLNIYTLKVLAYRTIDPAWLRWIGSAAAGIFVDFEHGALFKAPWLLLVPLGISKMRTGGSTKRLLWWLLAPAALYLLSFVLWAPREWHSAPTPVTRILLPLVPLFVVSVARAVSSTGRGRGLIWLSALLSAVYIAFPDLRFNHADGSDALLTLLGGSTGIDYNAMAPSLIGPVSAGLILWCSILIVSIASTFGRRFRVAGPVLALVALAGAGSLAPRGWLEAESLGGEHRYGCELYPLRPEAHIRARWFGSPQRLLRMSERVDRIVLSADDSMVPCTLCVTARSFNRSGSPCWGLRVATPDSVYHSFFDSPMIELPRWVAAIRGREAQRIRAEGREYTGHLNPGNLRDTTLAFPVTSPGMVEISAVPSDGWSVRERGQRPDSLSGVYLDRLELTR